MNAVDVKSMTKMDATYSPEDNKLRLRASSRLDAETYARVRAAGFIWAPRQELFVAPAWSPERGDLLVELCGDIGDEDTSLVERAEERAERFEDYSDKRETDAERAKVAVERIADGIPMGQPILVGHHSERRARRDAERIQNGMRKAVKLWETSKYWERRAKGALAHAKYKELPGVRHRRIKGLESDKRKMIKDRDQALLFIKLWSQPDMTKEKALRIANYGHGVSVWSDLDQDKITPTEAAERCIKSHTSTAERCERWLSHLENRLAYERAMLGESGGLAAERFWDIKVGGRVLIGRSGLTRIGASEWHVVERVNKGAEGRVNSVSVLGVSWTVGIETVRDYKDPQDGDAAKVKKANALPSLVNEQGDGFAQCTSEEWKRKSRSGSGCVRKLSATATHGACRVRECFAGGFNTKRVFVTDMPTKERPKLEAALEPVRFERELVVTESAPRAPKPTTEPTAFDAMKDTLKAGVQIVVNPDLFPTPPALARRMVEAARITEDDHVLEPSAGTGNIVRAILETGASVHAIESDPKLARMLGATFTERTLVECKDFLTLDAPGRFDVILMNPPFSEKRDVEHVAHALSLLAPGGRLVAIMSAGLRFRSDSRTAALRAIVSTFGHIEDLPEDSFKSIGTSVRTVLVTFTKPEAS